jgi:hypothetical protein
MLSLLKGKPNKKRQAPLFWIRPPDRPKQTKGAGDDAPDLAMRDGDYKLLMNCDGSRVELYNLIKDESETTNIASEKVALANSMKETLMAWYNDYPHLIDKNIYEMPTK